MLQLAPKRTHTVGDSRSLERKIAALKDAEARSEVELNKPLQYFAAKDYKKKEKPKSQRSPRKQQRPQKSLSGLPERKIDQPEPLEGSLDEESTPQNEQLRN